MFANTNPNRVRDWGLQTDWDPNRKAPTTASVPQKSFPAPRKSLTDKKEDEKKKIEKKTKEELLKKVEKMTKQIEMLGVKDDDDEKEDALKIKEVEFSQSANLVILPQIGGIEHPLYVGTPKAFNVSVGSRAWLHTYDELRASRWSLEFLKDWMKRSADIIKRDALYEVIDSEDNNRVEEFSMWFPDASRQEDRLDVGYSTLISAVRSQSRKNPFLPEIEVDEKGTSKDVCPPKFDFHFKGVKMTNFLRHWTSYNKNTPMYDIVGNTATQNFECGPPPGMRHSWVPLEWRKEIEKEFDLLKFDYVDPSIYQSYLVTLTKPEKLDKRMRERDEIGRPHITVESSDGGAFRLYLGQISLGTPVCPKREGIPYGEVSLREWCDLIDVGDDMYSFWAVLLNTRAPDTNGNRENPQLYKTYIYDHIKDKKGNFRRRMYADAPVRLFQQQMMKRYSGGHIIGEGFDGCKERFVQNVFQACVRSGLDISLRTDFIPDDYRDVIERLFEYGGNSQCYDPVVGLKNIQASREGRKFQSSDLKFSDVESKSVEERRKILRSFTNWFAKEQARSASASF